MNEPFKAAIGVTNQDFVFSANGQNILRCPIEDNSFLNNPISVQVTSCNDLEIKVQALDVFGSEGTAQMTSSAMKNSLYDASEADKMMARVYHH